MGTLFKQEPRNDYRVDDLPQFLEEAVSQADRNLLRLVARL